MAIPSKIARALMLRLRAEGNEKIINAPKLGGKAGAVGASERLRKRWQDQPELMREIVREASAKVPQGCAHPNAKTYTIFPPPGAGKPIHGVKNLSLWLRENAQILGKTPKNVKSAQSMTNPDGWKGWRAVAH